MVLRALKNCELIGASLGVSAFGNEEHDRRAGRAFQPRGMDGRRSLATSWLGFFYAFVAEVNGSRSELYVAAILFCFVWLATLGLPVLVSHTAVRTF